MLNFYIQSFLLYLIFIKERNYSHINTYQSYSLFTIDNIDLQLQLLRLALRNVLFTIILLSNIICTDQLSYLVYSLALTDFSLKFASIFMINAYRNLSKASKVFLHIHDLFDAIMPAIFWLYNFHRVIDSYQYLTLDLEWFIVVVILCVFDVSNQISLILNLSKKFSFCKTIFLTIGLLCYQIFWIYLTGKDSTELIINYVLCLFNLM